MNIFRHITSFILLVILQVFIFNNIFFRGYLNPYVYIIFILFLPLNVNRSTVMILAFLIGMCIDIFENSGGIHIAASVFLAYARRPLLRISSRKQGADFEDIRINKLAFGNLMLYLLLGIFLHHLVLFIIESFSFNDIGIILVRTGVSGAFTFLFVLLLQLMNFRKKV